MRRSTPAAETSATASSSRARDRQPQCAETRQRRAARGSGILRRHRYLIAPASNAGLAGGDEESRASVSSIRLSDYTVGHERPLFFDMPVWRKVAMLRDNFVELLLILLMASHHFLSRIVTICRH